MGTWKYLLLIVLIGLCGCAARAEASKGHDAAVIDFKIPAVVRPGEKFQIRIVYRNTGNNPWLATNGVALVEESLLEGARHWSESGRYELAAPTIAPGDTATFNLLCTAPPMPCRHLFSFRMANGDTNWFGPAARRILYVDHDDAADTPQNNSTTLVHLEAPTILVTGQVFTASVTMSNNGTRVWRDGETAHRLGTRIPNDSFWGLQRVPLPSSEVKPGDLARFEFRCVAPAVPGTYPFVWQMVEDGIEWFGITASHAIAVRDNQSDALAVPPPSQPSQGFRTDGTRNYSISSWSSEDGLPHNAVQTLLQSADGYLWIGTQKGLAQFDGQRFRVFDPPDAPELKHAFIYALSEGSDGSIWIGTFNSGCYQWRDGHVTRYSTANGLASDHVRSIFAGRDGRVWVGTTNGLSCFHHGHSTPRRFDGEVIRGICEDERDGIWVGTSEALHLIEGESARRHDSFREGFSAGAIRSLFCGRDGAVWIGSTAGLMRFQDGEMTLASQRDGLSHNMVSAIHEDADGAMWVGTYGGLNRFAAQRWRTHTLNEGSAFDAVNCILADREKNIWVGCKEGLFRLQRQSFVTYTQKHGLLQNNVTSVREDRLGRFWIGTWGGGLHLLENQHIVPWTNAPLSSDLILSLLADRIGTIWVGADFLGGANRIVDRFNLPYLQDQAQNDGAIRVLCEDREGSIWFGMTRSLARLKDGQFTRFTTQDGLAGNTIRALLEDSDGQLWIGTNEGLSRRRNGHFATARQKDGLSSEAVVSLYEDADRNLWIGTAGAGLWKIKNSADEQNGNNESGSNTFTLQVSRFTTIHGLFSDEIFEILEDDFGFLWLTSRHGIFRVQKRQLEEFEASRTRNIHCQVYGRRDGLVSLEGSNVAKPAAWKSRDRRLWFATAKGLSVVDPHALPETQPAPPVIVEQITADERIHNLQFKAPSREHRANAASADIAHESLQLLPGRGDLKIHYTALSLSAPEKNQFKYKLEGFDTDWVSAGTRRIAYYNNLYPGNYTFRVIACNHDGVWNSVGSSVRLTLQPHFWKTWWFKGFGIVACLSIAAGSARYATKRRMQFKLERLEHQHAIEKERARIAQNMHDDLGARLTEILMLSGVTASGRGGESGMKANAERVAAAAEDMVRNMDGIVWAINPQNDSLKHLTLYFYEYVERFLSSTNIRCRWEVPQDLPPLQLTAEVRHNLFLVLKEALNNTVKHSGATEVWIRLAISEGDLRLVIEDNGGGLVKQSGARIGHGLSGMEKRMEDVGGTFKLFSDPEKGTRLQFQIPLHR
jgi:ligand-binding sensor domain-containing protein/signal transduction histidine kinase